MSTTPKKPHKWAPEITAWGQGATIQVATFNKPQWSDCGPPGSAEMPSFEDADDVQYRVKPEPAAPVYPETNMSEDDLWKALVSAKENGRSTNVDEFRAIANNAIRRAIDDGQVVVPGSVVDAAEIYPAFQEMKTTAQQNEEFAKAMQKRLERAERALQRAGFEDRGGEEWVPPVSKAARTLIELGYMPVGGEWKLDPDFQEVKHQVQAKTERRTLDKLLHAERVLKANGFTYDEGIGWSCHSNRVSAQVRDAVNSVSEYKQRAHEAEKACARLNTLAHRVGRATAVFLGKRGMTDQQIAAIVLLERAK